MACSNTIWIVINHVRAGEFVAAFSTIDKAMEFLYARDERSWELEVRKVVLDRIPRDPLHPERDEQHAGS